MANGIGTGDPRGFNKGRNSKFREGSRVRQTLEEGRRTYRPKRFGNNYKDEDNSPKTFNDDNYIVKPFWGSASVRNYSRIFGFNFRLFTFYAIGYRSFQFFVLHEWQLLIPSPECSNVNSFARVPNIYFYMYNSSINNKEHYLIIPPNFYM